MNKEIVIKNEVEELDKLAAFVEEVASELGLGPEEVVSNVILYAYPNKEEGKVTIAAKGDVKSLVFTITDKGKEFDPTKVEEADITLSAEDRQIGGLGIYIVKNIMNEVTYQRLEGHNVLTLKKTIDE